MTLYINRGPVNGPYYKTINKEKLLIYQQKNYNLGLNRKKANNNPPNNWSLKYNI